VGVDSVWEQEKLEARKMPQNPTLPALSLSKGQVRTLFRSALIGDFLFLPAKSRLSPEMSVFSILFTFLQKASKYPY
jgi:hypothetical protein